jgi:potassium-transporting ATPase ATP-binding subunit
MTTATHTRSMFDPTLVKPAIMGAFLKLDPRYLAKNPVMFVTEVCSVFTLILGVRALFGEAEAPAAFILAVSGWLWATVLFSNFS